MYHERDRENGPLLQALGDDALSVCSTETVRSMTLVVQPDLCFSLWKSSYTRSPPLRREERLHGLFFWFENKLSVQVIEDKKGKQKNTSLRPIVGSKKAEKKSPSVALEYTRT